MMLVTAFDLLLKYATNLLKPKLPSLWRTIPVTSGTFKARVDCMKGAREILKLIGYSVETANALKFPDEQLDPDRDKLAEIAAEILMAKVHVEERINNTNYSGRHVGPPRTQGDAYIQRSSSSPPTAVTQPYPGNPLPSRGGTLTSEGNTLTSHGNPLPSRGGTLTSEGNTLTSHGNPLPSRGGTQPSEGNTLTSHGSTLPSQDNTIPSQGGTQPLEGSTLQSPSLIPG